MSQLKKNQHPNWKRVLLLFVLGWSILGQITFMDIHDIEGSTNTVINSIPIQAANPVAIEIFVSPTGNDAGAGSESDPFQTIAKAQQVARNWTNSSMVGDVIVTLRGGTHTLANSFELNQSDSGQNNFNVIYRNYATETPILSGGVAVSGWQQGSDGIWSAASPVYDYRQLYVNGQRAVRARGDVSMIKSSDGDGHLLKDTTMSTWKNLQDVEIVYKDIWTIPRIHIDSYSKDGPRILMQQPAYSQARTKGGTHITDPTWIENAFELLDEPGEWYLNKSQGKVFYKPKSGEDMATANVIVPNIQNILKVEGNSTLKAKNLKFQGLSFQYGTWLTPNKYGTGFVDLQANVYLFWDGTTKTSAMSPGNVVLRYAQNIAIENCSFHHLGAGGLEIQAGTNETLVTGNIFNDISGIGLQIGEVSYPMLDPTHPQVVRDINIMNNYITNCSVEYMGGPGIFTGYVRNVRIEHNTISNIKYTGISVGWGWSATPTVCANNTVKYNRIYGVMTYLTDGAAIYTLSTQPGTDVSYNVIHDSGWSGLYPDERTNQTTWSYNVVWSSFNMMQNHIMYYDEMNPADAYALNNISNNYFDEKPWFAQPKDWDKTEGTKQIYGVKPGDSDFPQWIVDMSGVEPGYRHLIPENEWYWKYTVFERILNPLGANLYITIALFIGFGVVILIGIAKIVGKKEYSVLTTKDLPPKSKEGGNPPQPEGASK